MLARGRPTNMQKASRSMLVKKACVFFMTLLTQMTTVVGGSPTPTPIVVDPTALGIPFDGIGGVNGGNGARLLANYPQPQRDAVLDLLFSPQVGCALNILKVRKNNPRCLTRGVARRGVVKVGVGSAPWALQGS